MGKYGNTPIKKVKLADGLQVYAKLESYNPTGSMKDRPANYVLDKICKEQLLNYNGIIESSSGNMGIALAKYAKEKGIDFYCVIDPKIQKENLAILSKFNSYVILATQKDQYGGYLISRLKLVKKIMQEKNLLWFNQYNNIDVIYSYISLANEIYEEVKRIDYIFIATSSCGCIAGVSNRLKVLDSQIQVIAVDIDGSIIFNNKPQNRNIPGIGASIIPPNKDKAIIDDVIHVSDKETLHECLNFADKYFKIGGSSGAILAGIKKYYQNHCQMNNKNIVAIFPDDGNRYNSTIYNDKWRWNILKEEIK